MKDKGGDLKQATKKTEISLKSRHFAHKGASSQGIKHTESSQELKTHDIKQSVPGSLLPGKDFSAEKKLVMQQMTAKEKPNDASLQDEASDENRTTKEHEISEKPDSFSAASNVEVLKGSGNPSSVKQTVYSSAEIKPRNSNLAGASVNVSSTTSSQPEERTNLTQSDKSSVVEEDNRAKAKTSLTSKTSHLVAANYSFFPVDNEQTESDQPINAKVK